MWFRAISSHVDLLVLSHKGPFALERVGCGTRENIIHSGKNSPCLALGVYPRSAVSCRGKNTDACQRMQHTVQRLNCHDAGAVSLSPFLSQTAQQSSMSDIHLKLDRVNLGFSVLSFIIHMWS